MQEPRSIDKIAEIDSHIACANSGLTADSRTLMDHARVETQVCPSFPLNLAPRSRLSLPHVSPSPS